MKSFNSKVYGIIQARLGSTRLPNKVMLKVGKEKLIDRVLTQAKKIRNVNYLCVATTTEPEDIYLGEYWKSKFNLKVFNGDTYDVLKRFWDCYLNISKNSYNENDLILRITADDPFKCPELSEECIELALQDPTIDYCSNISNNGYPEGLDVEVVRVSALKRAFLNSHKKIDREHVTYYIWNRPKQFKIKNLKYRKNYSDYRLTIDHRNDLKTCNSIANLLGYDYDWKQLKQIIKNNKKLFINNENKRYEALSNSC